MGNQCVVEVGLFLALPMKVNTDVKGRVDLTISTRRLWKSLWAVADVHNIELLGSPLSREDELRFSVPVDITLSKEEQIEQARERFTWAFTSVIRGKVATTIGHFPK